MYTYTIVVGGRGSPGNHPPPQYLLTYSYKENPLTGNNTQQDTRTPNNRQQHTTTVDNSTLIHKITNVPLFKKLWDIIFFWWDNHFISRSFLNSGTLIVRIPFSCYVMEMGSKLFIPSAFIRRRAGNNFDLLPMGTRSTLKRLLLLVATGPNHRSLYLLVSKTISCCFTCSTSKVFFC
jgi:hypothetical protein